MKLLCQGAQHLCHVFQGSVIALQAVAWWSRSSWRHAWRGPKSPSWLQSFGSTACRMPARIPCWQVFQLQATSSRSPDPVLYSKGLQGRSLLRNAFKYKVMNDCFQISRKHFSPAEMTFKYFRLFLRSGPIAKILQN